MTREDILQALRLTAMGRYGHDLQVQLAEKLEQLFSQGCVHASAADCEAARMNAEATAMEKVREQLRAEGKLPPEYQPQPVEVLPELPPLKRGPGRPKKAD